MSRKIQLTQSNLAETFTAAKITDALYVGLLIEMPGTPAPETIINPRENFDVKHEYYKNTYDENMEHKYSKGVKIVGFTYGSTYQDIEEDLIKMQI